MDKGLKDLIKELRDYAAPRKGELAGMLLEAANRLEEQSRSQRRWITGRKPTAAETEEAGDTGFILCISGTSDNIKYHNAVVMGDNYYENGKWYVRGCSINDDIKVHAFMVPPAWEAL